MKLLSICIPTYNRASFLKESLPAILNFIDPRNYSEIEIVISDNCSTDDTQLVIASFLIAKPELEWINVRQEPNIGPSNVILVTKYASGKFLWILSDDDVVFPDSINKIIHELKNDSNINGILVNYAGFKKDIKKVDHPILPLSAKMFNGDEALLYLGNSINFISSVIFKRDDIKIENKFLDNSLPHSFVFLQALRHGNFKAIPSILLGMRIGNSGGYDFYTVFVETFSQVLEYALHLGFSEKAVNLARKKQLRTQITVYSIIFKTEEKFESLESNYSNAAKLILKHHKTDYYSYLIIMILYSPSFLIYPINFLRKIRRKILNQKM